MAGGGSGAGSRWLISYADLVTLLMVFFMVLFAMTNVDKEKYQALAGSLSVALGGGRGVLPGTDSPGMPLDLELMMAQAPASQVPPPSSGVQTPPDTLQMVGHDIAVDIQQYGRFHVYSNERGITVSLLGSALFHSGEASIRPEARPILDAVAMSIKNLPNDISVEGSADEQPIATAAFPSNWELSARRATEVIRYMVEAHAISPSRFIAVGYAEQRPVFQNDTEEGRAGNRRVDIVVLRQPQNVNLGQRIKP